MKYGIKKLLGSRIKELRVAKKWTQEALAEKIEVDPKYMSRIEVGANYPSPEALERIAHALGVEAKDLFDFAHLQHTIEIKHIESVLKGADEQKLRMMYRIAKDIVL